MTPIFSSVCSMLSILSCHCYRFTFLGVSDYILVPSYRGGRASIKARPNLLFKTFCCLIKVRPLIFSAPETRSVCFDNLEEVGLGEIWNVNSSSTVKNALGDGANFTLVIMPVFTVHNKLYPVLQNHATALSTSISCVQSVAIHHLNLPGQHFNVLEQLQDYF